MALHVRWFESGEATSQYNLPLEYNRRAIELIERDVSDAQSFVFSDDAATARERLTLPADRAVFVTHNRGMQDAYADLWLMTQCRHFITANGTFSWWGAWLGGSEEKIVVTPAPDTGGRNNRLEFCGTESSRLA